MALIIVTHDENIHDGFDKKFRMTDGMIEKITNDKFQNPNKF